MDAAPVEFPLPGGDVMPLQPATVSPEDRTHINSTPQPLAAQPAFKLG
jgi:hypothetical protein